MKNRTRANVLFLPFAYGSEFHLGVAQYASEHGWHLNADMAWTRKIPQGWRGDGVITLLTDDKESLRFIRSLKVPVVDMAVLNPTVALHRVIKDNEKIGLLGARHFLDQGWRSFAFLSRTDSHVCQLRIHGYREALRNAGYDCEVFILAQSFKGDLNDWEAMRAYVFKAIKRLPKPLALMAFNDYDAAFVMDVCLASGLRVPGDVGVLGSDDSSLVCNCLPVTLSSVNPDTTQVGYQAGAILDRLMSGRRAPEWTLVPPRGVTQRQSTNLMVVRDARLAQAVEFLLANLEKPLSLDQTAARIGISRGTLYSLFLQELAQNPAEFIRRRRMRMAEALLLETNDNIESVARRCGLTHHTLIRLFQKEHGMTPQQWRDRM